MSDQQAEPTEDPREQDTGESLPESQPDEANPDDATDIQEDD